MSLPTVALIALVVTMLSNSQTKRIVKEAHMGQTPGGHSQDRPTGPSQMWIDRPVNTVLRNDAKGDSPSDIDRYLRTTYMTEAASHPGVRLVAGKAVA